jgi:hypothetical protein
MLAITVMWGAHNPCGGPVRPSFKVNIFSHFVAILPVGNLDVHIGMYTVLKFGATSFLMPSKINNVVFSDFLQEDRIKVE